MVLARFREELFALRVEFALVLGVIASVTMLLSDSYGAGPVTPSSSCRRRWR